MYHLFKNKLSLLVMICFSPIFVIAGWTSSGGETLKDKINPWFLKNTPVVRYCILHDASNFGQPIEQVRQRIQKALQVWKFQLKNMKVEPIQGRYNPVVGSQEFIETHCELKGDKVVSNDADLYFQFGVLSGEQFRYLGDPTKYIGVTVRTEYDPINLRGKGFIYFSPQDGPLKLNKTGLIQNPWSSADGAYLFLALVHETAHVFGFQHNDALFTMSESFLESQLSEVYNQGEDDFTWAKTFESKDLLLKFNLFKFDVTEDFKMQTACSARSISSPPVPVNPPPELSKKVKSRILRSLGVIKNQNIIYDVLERFLGIPISDDQYQSFCYSIQKRNGAFVYEASYRGEDGLNQIIGRSENLVRADTDRDQKGILSIWLPKEQKVFDMGDYAKNYLERRLDIGLIQSVTLFKGTYTVFGSPNIERPLFIEASPLGRIRLGGVLDGVYYYDLSEEF